MFDVRDNLGWLLGCIVAAFTIAFGAIYQSGILSTLIGVTVGSGITYFVQTKTQNRAWKREYGIKIAVDVYGNLFKEMKSIIKGLGEKYRTYWIQMDKWKEFQEDHRYFMVNKDFRIRLDDFCVRLDKYSEGAVRIGSPILPEIIFDEIERVFRLKTQQIPLLTIFFSSKAHPVSTVNVRLVDCLVSGTHPKDYPRTIEPEAKFDNLSLAVMARDGERLFGYCKEFEDFWQNTLKHLRETPTYTIMVEDNPKVLEAAHVLQKEITKRIEEPWKI